MQADGAGWVPRTDDPDAVYDAVTTWVEQHGLSLYPHQDEAIIELLGGSNVVLATPTGSGKSLVAMAAHAAALAGGRVSFYTAPIKALVSEKFFALCEVFGPENVGMLTGDASVNSDAPIICCTAEVLANIALREGPDADVGLVVMDEFHFYSEPDRGWAWQVPLLELSRAQFVLMSATLGDISELAADLTRRTGRETAVVDDAERPVPLVFSWVMTHLTDTLAELVETNQAPVYVVHFTQANAVEHATSLLAAKPGIQISRETREAINERLVGFRFGAGFGKTLHKLVRRGIGVHHAGMLPRYRRLVEQLAQSGLLVVICGTDTLGVGINVPIRTVLFTGLAKFDGTRQRILRSREFRQIAGRAGRAGFDTMGYVVVQAPEHVIDNAIALKKIGDDPRKQKSYRRKKAPDGEVVWSEETFDKLVAGTPEQLVSRMKVDNAMLVNVVSREADAFPILRRLLTDNHESPANQRKLARRALRLARSLLRSGVLTRLDELDEFGRRYVLTVDLPVDFALNQPLSHFALAAFDVLDPESDEYTLDLVSVVESVLEAPRQILAQQQYVARGVAVAEMKADGIEYEERMALLDEITWPMPLRELLEATYAIYRETHPWLPEDALSPKSVVREMYEQGMSFTDFVTRYQLARSEGLVLRYLTDAYRTLRQTVPDHHRTPELEGLSEWLGETVRQIDSSLLDEWEALTDPEAVHRHALELAEHRPPDNPRPISKQERAFGVMIRNAMFRRVQLVARDDLDGLMALERAAADRTDPPGEVLMTRSVWDEAIEAYYAEHDEVLLDADARGPDLLRVERTGTVVAGHPDPPRPGRSPRLGHRGAHRRRRLRRDRRAGARHAGLPPPRRLNRSAATAPEKPVVSRPGLGHSGDMGGLPTGTVSLLFSDIEGSTALLSRLGPSYAEALSAQRRVLRAAWAAYGGTELGTEGDSFYVVFTTAENAVAAAASAQRELDRVDWPAGEQVRVRIGIHTGAPTVHDGGYVGMDVHRAARIAAAAHGGQIVVSESTATLVAGRLPEGATLRDLGRHQLKDIPAPEHLFQVSLADLQVEFVPLKTLGTASSLPAPPTPLVGRDGELAELLGLVRSPGLRLLTLTGLGGSGKTRLAIGVASRLTETFPDGIYFVPLAAATTPDVMWMTMAEVLGVPTESRVLPGFLEYAAHLRALFVLDNLEQLPGADLVVSQLLNAAPHVVVIATSRRPLHVGGEHEHPVPTLELPARPDLAHAERSGAVQLFVQQATMVRPGFALTEANVADVVEICRRLDGLPLALELAAARVKLLGPAALVSRLGTALELSDTGVDRPSRQQTLRTTIGWSYDLLTGAQQAVFRRLGVFAGGADLDAVDAVTAGVPGSADTLELVAGLVDASLVIVGEGPGGEPRVSLLETVRVFAQERLRDAGELDDVRGGHARHCAAYVESLASLQRGPVDRRLEGRSRFEAEHENLREALTWALDSGAVTTEATDVGLRLCHGSYGWWLDGGYFAEGRRWLVRAIAQAGPAESPALARCLTDLTNVLSIQGDFAAAHEAAVRSVELWRLLAVDRDDQGLAAALTALGSCELSLGHAAEARRALQESVDVAGRRDDRAAVADALRVTAFVEASEQDYERAVGLAEDAIALYVELGDEYGALRLRHSHACYLRLIGRADDARGRMQELIPDVLRLADASALLVLTEDFGAVLAEVGHHETAARLLGAADAARERKGAPREPPQQAQIDPPYAVARAALAATWDQHYAAGRALGIEDALASLPTPSTQPAS